MKNEGGVLFKGQLFIYSAYEHVCRWNIQNRSLTFLILDRPRNVVVSQKPLLIYYGDTGYIDTAVKEFIPVLHPKASNGCQISSLTPTRLLTTCCMHLPHSGGIYNIWEQHETYIWLSFDLASSWCSCSLLASQGMVMYGQFLPQQQQWSYELWDQPLVPSTSVRRTYAFGAQTLPEPGISTYHSVEL